MKIKEIKTTKVSGFGGMLGPEITQSRVRELAEGEPLPAGAVEVDDDTPATDWKEEE
jgi:hypothetical protein